MARNGNQDSEVVPAVDGEVAADAVVKAPKVKKAPTRGELPAGYVTPVGLAKEITARGLHSNKAGIVTELKPQVVYSYIKNATKDDAFPMEKVTDSIGKERDVVSLDAGIAWWTRKNDRAAARVASAVTKAAAKAAKAAAAPADASPVEVG